MSIALVKDDKGDLFVKEGAFQDLSICEAENIARMDDNMLKAMRKKFVAARMEVKKKHDEMEGVDKYSSPEGSELYAEIEYYNCIIRRIEWEMQDRYMTLD